MWLEQSEQGEMSRCQSGNMGRSCRTLQVMKKTLAFTLCEMEAWEGIEQGRNVI